MKNYREAFFRMTEDLSAKRKPVLRRADEKDHLFATDLPTLIESRELKRFLETADALGWTVTEKGNWILLDPLYDFEREIRVEESAEMEACLDLAERHETIREPEILRAVLKVSEKSAGEQERFFEELHGELAKRLREKQALPVLRMLKRKG